MDWANLPLEYEDGVSVSSIKEDAPLPPDTVAHTIPEVVDLAYKPLEYSDGVSIRSKNAIPDAVAPAGLRVLNFKSQT